MGLFSGLLSAGSSLLGGILGRNKEAKTQKEFAQKGIQWKVADAKAAGIAPVYALGAQTHSYTPQSVGDMGMGDLGQNIGRAIDSTRSAPQKTAAHNQMTSLALERGGLENELLKTKIASERRLLTQPGTPPARPSNTNIAGQGDSGVPMYVKTYDPRDPNKKMKWIINPDIASDFGEMLAPEVLPHMRSTIDRAHQSVNRAKKQMRLNVRKIQPDNWWDYLVPSISYERRK